MELKDWYFYSLFALYEIEFIIIFLIYSLNLKPLPLKKYYFFISLFKGKKIHMIFFIYFSLLSFFSLFLFPFL